MPQYSGMAFVVIQHPTHVGILQLLQRNTAMEVLQVTDRLKYYLIIISTIPPNKSLTILNGVLHLFALFKVGGCDYRSIYSFLSA
jgi:two-component system CheB/CheR fusion protein